ncbi:MAG: hypothetical protein HKN31_09690, partial [Pricia sp.]|nr:hypothetical protein [Pricia sp.]
SIRPAPHNYMVMGQICIDKAFRGKGVFRQLYETMRLTLLPEFASIITEVDAENLRSLHAHYAIGFTDLKTYRAGGRVWRLIDLKSEK